VAAYSSTFLKNANVLGLEVPPPLPTNVDEGIEEAMSLPDGRRRLNWRDMNWIYEVAGLKAQRRLRKLED
jgi:hypothetical protein